MPLLLQLGHRMPGNCPMTLLSLSLTAEDVVVGDS